MDLGRGDRRGEGLRLASRRTDLEDRGAELQGVALAQATGVVDALAVDERAVAGAEILDHGGLALDSERGMAARDGLVAQLEVGALVTPDRHRALDGVLGPGAGALLDDEPDIGHPVESTGGPASPSGTDHAAGAPGRSARPAAR